MRQRVAYARELVENWAVWRDAGDWERFRTCWHDDGWMMATWFQGPAEKFVEVSRAGWDKGVSILHFLGGSSIELAGVRAVRSGDGRDVDPPRRVSAVGTDESGLAQCR